MRANAVNARRFIGAVLDELSKEEHLDLVNAKHLEGGRKFGVSTHQDGKSKAALEKMEWLFPGYFSILESDILRRSDDDSTGQLDLLSNCKLYITCAGRKIEDNGIKDPLSVTSGSDALARSSSVGIEGPKISVSRMPVRKLCREKANAKFVAIVDLPYASLCTRYSYHMVHVSNSSLRWEAALWSGESWPSARWRLSSREIERILMTAETRCGCETTAHDRGDVLSRNSDVCIGPSWLYDARRVEP
ncbi:hypothetical protein MRB53_040674 [Persea americana]|nr:hypothetical protein MRB53_040674 [Persea americana]